ncbi:MAG: protein-glutamate O-methyltransferase CheR [Betaproteobacteria bacterium]|nr:protein-glutamate O-methyltransferase CheR [Betaproteobacteria bacterium]
MGQPAMNGLTLSDSEFSQFQSMIRQVAGISMADSKKPLVSGRLARRVREHGLGSYGEYFRLVMQGGEEFQTAVDLLTTNETFFFREARHFDFLRDRILTAHDGKSPFRVWSAASSSGEEVWSLAMLLQDQLGDSAWEVLGSDISVRMLQTATRAIYPLERARDLPQAYRSRFCLKGVGEYDGKLMVAKPLHSRVQFRQVNLIGALPALGAFDVIFLRNVMIYFDLETKRNVVERLYPLLRPGGHFIISHSESLNGVSERFDLVAPSIYRKPDASV